MFLISSSSPFVNTLVLVLLQALTNPVLIIFATLALGYLIGKINIKGVSFGNAGVFLAALVLGVIFGVAYQPINEFAARFQSPGSDPLIAWLRQNTHGHTVADQRFIIFRTFGLCFFIAGIALIAGPTFFRNFKKNGLAFVTMGVTTTAVGAIIVIIFIATGIIGDPALATGLYMGALSTTPGLAAALGAFPEHAAIIATANGIAYPLGVLGVVFFVQLTPKLMRRNMDTEREKLRLMLQTNEKREVNTPDAKVVTDTKIVASESGASEGSGQALAANAEVNDNKQPSSKADYALATKKLPKKLFEIDKLGIAALALVIVAGFLVGSITFRAGSANIALGTVGGILILGLIAGHFGKIGRLSLAVPDKTAKLARELGLVVFLAVVGFDGGLNFINVLAQYPLLLLWGFIMTMAPIFAAFLIGHFVFKMPLLSTLGGVTGGMTSTPGLGALIHGSKTEDVGFAYAAAYPVALLTLIFVPTIVLLIFSGRMESAEAAMGQCEYALNCVRAIVRI